MFRPQLAVRDRIFIAAVSIALVAVLAWIWTQRQTPSERLKPKRVLYLNPVKQVFACERDGERVLSDRPCGSGATVRSVDPPQEKRTGE